MPSREPAGMKATAKRMKSRKPARKKTAPKKKPRKKPARKKPARKKPARAKSKRTSAGARGAAAKRGGYGSEPRRPLASAGRRKRRATKPDARRPKKRTPPPPAFLQRADASPKQHLLFELLRARTSVRAAVAGLTAGSANEPMAPGKWSARETLLHLVTRDQVRLNEMEAAL